MRFFLDKYYSNSDSDNYKNNDKKQGIRNIGLMLYSRKKRMIVSDKLQMKS